MKPSPSHPAPRGSQLLEPHYVPYERKIVPYVTLCESCTMRIGEGHAARWVLGIQNPSKPKRGTRYRPFQLICEYCAMWLRKQQPGVQVWQVLKPADYRGQLIKDLEQRAMTAYLEHNPVPVAPPRRKAA